MKLKYSLSFLTAIILSGCGTCSVQNFNKITPANQNIQISTYTDGPKHITVKPVDDVKLDIGSCSNWNNSLCITASLPKGRRMKFTNDEFIELDAESGSLIKTHKTDLIRYTIVCKDSNNGNRVCDSSEESPTVDPVETKSIRESEYKGNKSYIYWMRFPVTHEFTGAEKILGPLGLTGSREYELPITVDMKFTDRPRIFRFPDITVDGKPYKLPDINVSKVNEELCHYRSW